MDSITTMYFQNTRLWVWRKAVQWGSHRDSKCRSASTILQCKYNSSHTSRPAQFYLRHRQTQGMSIVESYLVLGIEKYLHARH